MLKSIASAVVAFSFVASAQTQDSVSPGAERIDKVAERIDKIASREPAELAAVVRLQAAGAIRGVDAALSRRLIDEAVRQTPPSAYPVLLGFLSRSEKEVATQVFKSIPFDHPVPPWDRWLQLRCVLAMADADPAEASSALQKAPIPKDSPDYRRAVAALLHNIDPQAYEKRADLVSDEINGMSQKDGRMLAMNLIFASGGDSGGAPGGASGGGSTGSGAAPASPPDPAVPKIADRLKELRGDLSPSDRAKLAESFASDIQALHDPRNRLGLAATLSSLATEGDLGHDALQTVTDTLGLAIRDAKPQADGNQFLELAKLVRYEHMKSPIEDPSLDSRLELLHLRELIAEHTDFTLGAIDGQSYSLKDLRGKVVVVNFWATWCPPCRKEMPDLEQLSQRFRDRGFVVLAISDEPADTVKSFIAKLGYTFPVLLDPGRRVTAAFHVEGIPKTFIFGRDGKLVAHAIDMRTNAQFLALLKQAGLE